MIMEQNRLRLPAFLAKVGARLPEPFVSLHFVAGLEVARMMHWLNPPEELEGKVFLIRVEDLGVASRFRVVAGRFRPCMGQDEDLSLSACAADFLVMMQGEMDADTLFFQRRLRISGDTELGLVVKNWLDTEERPAWLRRLAGALLPG